MKIWGEIPKILGVYDRHKNVGRVEKTQGVASKKDVLSISNQAKDYQTVMRAIRDVPDMRMDKVNELAEKYSSGTYDVKGGDVAQKILQSIVDKKV